MNQHANRKKASAGFALVITISMMVILVVLAVGLLSLSTIALKTSSLSAAEARAQANARMALMMAIDRLQNEMGPDQRISANSDILSDTPIKNPHWLGTWNSWKAGATASGADTKSEHNTIEGATNNGMAPTYQTNRKDHFRSWLVSLSPSQQEQLDLATTLQLDPNRMPDQNDVAVTLVEKGTLGKSGLATDFVTVPLIPVSDQTGSTTTNGRYAWWIGDESQKGMIMDDSYVADTASLQNSDRIFRTQAPASMGTQSVEELKNVTDQKYLTNVPSFRSLDIIADLSNGAGGGDSPSYRFHDIGTYSMGLLTDVREGGLKRDLSALLERKIDPTEVDNYPNEYSLYKFNTKDSWAGSLGSMAPQECVPIQDLAAYYQLYDSVSPEAAAQDPLRASNLRGVRYAPTTIGTKTNGINGMHMMSMDFGTTSFSPIYPTAYSANYRQPRIIKIQLLASLFSKPINPPIPPTMANPNPNTHEMLIGITPSITFWNPTNLPVMFQMNSNPALGAQMLRFAASPIQIRFNKNNGQTITTYENIANLGGVNDGNIFSLYWAGIHPITLEPGELKTCSLPFSGDLSGLKALHGYNGHWNQGWAMSSFFMKTDTWYVGHEVKVGWEPESFIYCNSSAVPGTNNGTVPNLQHVVNGKLRFKATDRIQVEIGSGNNSGIGWGNNSSSYQDYTAAWTNWDRMNSQVGMRGGAGTAFYQPLFRRGMTGGAATLTAPSRSGSSIIARSSTEAGWPFMHFGVMAGTETSEASNAGFAGGRKFAGRPFLHSSTLPSRPFLDNSTGNDLYNFGWNWTVDLLNDVYEAPVQVTSTGSGYWGGGYTPESGTTHIIQQEIPITPPISIAALSHARLGGWSISDQLEMPYGSAPGQMGHISATRARSLTRAVGYGGLRPHTLQAIGNSYAHPLIPAGLAYTTVSRTYETAEGAFSETFADHSYLANKAIWDEFCFSSITPQRAAVKVFNTTTSREALDVAKDFFFNEKTLPNRRIRPYTANIDNSKLTALFAQKDTFTDGLADKIAAHLMVEGSFNINSTSVNAWKVLFSSLKGKPVPYLTGAAAMAGNNPSLATPSGTPVGQVGLTGGQPYSGSPADPRTPEQWTSWRELTDTEISELATAMVKQVKLRGPFLSLSEFVNRRLDAANPELAVKGALQSALDDPAVSINKAFQANDRKFSAAEIASMSPAFPLAAEGPIAYGSSAYIDQADILRGFAEQLTPRGDTFVIRAYGDALDAKGKVEARAWCEAVIQRLPDYVDSVDSPETKQAGLTAITNQIFGRKMQILSFRWLNSSEV